MCSILCLDYWVGQFVQDDMLDIPLKESEAKLIYARVQQMSTPNGDKYRLQRGPHSHIEFVQDSYQDKFRATGIQGVQGKVYISGNYLYIKEDNKEKTFIRKGNIIVSFYKKILKSSHFKRF